MKYDIKEVVEKAVLRSEERMRFLSRNECFMIIEGYRDGEHLITVACGSHEGRAMALKMTGALGADLMLFHADTYVSTESSLPEEGDFREPLSERFDRGDESVSEAVSITACTMQDSGLFHTHGAAIPYTRDSMGIPAFDRIWNEGDEPVSLGGAIVDQLKESLHISAEVGGGVIPPMIRRLFEGLVLADMVRFIAVRADIIEGLEGDINPFNINDMSIISNGSMSENALFSRTADLLRVK